MAKIINLYPPDPHKNKKDWTKIGAFATIIGVIVAIIIGYFSINNSPKENEIIITNLTKTIPAQSTSHINEIYPDILVDFFPVPDPLPIKRIIQSFGEPDKIDTLDIELPDFKLDLDLFIDSIIRLNYKFQNGEISFFHEIEDNFLTAVYLTIKENVLVNIPHIWVHGYYYSDEDKNIILGKSKFKEIISLEHLKSLELIQASGGTIDQLYCEAGYECYITGPYETSPITFKFIKENYYYREDNTNQKEYNESYLELLEVIPMTIRISLSILDRFE